jgi:hypothetical protein
LVTLKHRIIPYNSKLILKVIWYSENMFPGVRMNWHVACNLIAPHLCRRSMQSLRTILD